MRRVSALGVVGAVGLAAVAGAPGTGWAATAPPTVGSIKSSISAPATAHAGSTYSFSVTMTQTSSYQMLLDGPTVTIWLPADTAAYVASHNAMKWYNPATGAWVSPTSVENSTGDYQFDLGQQANWLPVAPHGSVTFKFQLSLGSSVHAGTYHLSPAGVWYELENSSGAAVDDQLDVPQTQTTFSVGGGSSSSGSTRKPASGTGVTSKSTDKTVSPAQSAAPSPAAVHSSSAASPSASPLTASTSDAPIAAAAPSPAHSAFDPVLSASSSSRTATRVLWPLSFVVMSSVTAVYILARRRRAQGAAGAGGADGPEGGVG